MKAKIPSSIADNSFATEPDISICCLHIREAIERHIADMEDIYLAEQTLERVRRGEETTYTLSEVEQELGLEN